MRIGSYHESSFALWIVGEMPRVTQGIKVEEKQEGKGKILMAPLVISLFSVETASKMEHLNGKFL